jgi:hypothetical protein
VGRLPRWALLIQVLPFAPDDGFASHATDALRILAAHGWAGTRGLGAARLKREIAGSRRFPRSTFHVPVNFFAYPSGAFDSAAAAVRKAGFRGAATTEYGLARRDELYRLHRIQVAKSDGLAGLAAKLRWVG